MDRKRDRLAYASKEDAHQVDDWPEAHNKSQDVLVRYKDTRGSMLHLPNLPVSATTITSCALLSVFVCFVAQLTLLP